jgi:hypothetical protein
LLAAALYRADAAEVVPIGEVTVERLGEAMAHLLDGDGPKMADRAGGLVRGGGGVVQAARTILEVHRRRRAAR